MASIPFSKIKKVKDLYYGQLFSMKKVAQELHVSINALVYFMRKYDLKRRSVRENEKIKFDRKPLSFKISTDLIKNAELKAIGAMLYWGEGAKGGKAGSCNSVDFANSDPKMIIVFMRFLRDFCGIDEKRLRCYLYCYSDQKPKKLIKFWSKFTQIPANQFTKPYIRRDFKKNSRKMEYGLIHIRYNDKKLLIEIENMIEYYMNKYASIA